MAKYFRLYPHDTSEEVALFSTFDETLEKMTLRSEYRDLACSKCGKIDEVQALERGLADGIEVPYDRDFSSSFELLPIVSLRMRNLLAGRADAVRYYRLPAAPGYFVAVPRLVLWPDPQNPAFRVFGQCAACGRHTEVVWGREPLTLDQQFDVGVFWFEKHRGASGIWVVSQPVAKALKEAKPRLRGIMFERLSAVVQVKRS